ncbi:3'-5' exoribonuclease [Candidatus Phytoplasma luffae]|uniref:3'-5' exoribonuclease n=1 Tax=Loofah witches'-broom phytoplasma TaxID=35773 RepID=A0A975FJ20_LOWBP|nr:HD domain-containing protein [Candidatus Phytoplasma luffae]QTX02815.1 3'-5' exoribonuclease [Candidatus Phytoplasma luffae]
MNQTIFLKDKKIGDKIRFIGKLNSLNKGENFFNIDLLLKENFCINIKLKIENESLIKEKIYVFDTEYITMKNKNILFCEKYNIIENVLDWEQIYYYYNIFFKCSSLSFSEIDKRIDFFLSEIKNPILKKITNNLYQKNKKKFLISPASCKMHHNYYGGLGFHTCNMLKISNDYHQIYPFLNKDLLISGIILHDMAKIQEFDFINKKYNKEGTLIGHLILGNNNIHEEAILLGYQNKEEILLLKHLIIAHHGLLQYGSAKEPQISEALLIWYLDDLDAKLDALREKIKQTPTNEFTDSLPVINNKRFYNHNLDSE